MINNRKELAKKMAGEARILSGVIEKSLTKDSTLKCQMDSFKELLIKDISHKEFADVYAQTVVYGMFIARLQDTTSNTFNMKESFNLIPKSSPFFINIFKYVASDEVDDDIKKVTDSLIEIFLSCDIEKVLNVDLNNETEDPIIHFYEYFLSEYDPVIRKARGVWYTPAPVVNFIVRAVDDILKNEFDISNGLSDSSKVVDKESGKLVHKVQILDPATGTGTFLSEVIKQVHKSFKNEDSMWSKYVEEDLLPRLTGFELLMASYAMAHLQLDWMLKETGFKHTKETQKNIYLVNTLEKNTPEEKTLFD